MSDQYNQPDIQDRQLLPARPKVSISKEIGEAVITETIFGKAKVRIIRKNDKFHRAMWLLALVGVGIVAAATWQGWVASQRSEAVPEVVPAVTPGADVAEAAPASQAEAWPTLESAQPVLPSQTAIVNPMAVQQSSAPVAVTPVKPTLAPRPVTVKPQSATQPTGILAAPQFATALPPKPVFAKPPKPAAAATTASSPAIAMPLSSPLAQEAAPATVEPTTPQAK
ncbi:MAG: hypothetical protein HY799_08095 [Nitrosomonadales bacterium]|nr:hypothetical protein [Nitrosomonadales bacterium]